MGVGTARGNRRLAARAQGSGLGCGLAVISGTITLTVIVLVALAFFFLVPRGTSSPAAVVQAQPGAVSWDSGAPTTLLLVSTPDAPGSAATGFVVVSYQPAIHGLSLLSIPSNLWVTVPGYGQATLGQSYADGGLRLMLITVQSVLGMPLPYYAVAGEHLIAQIVDAFGGVPVRLSSRVQLGAGASARSLGPGPVTLNGADTVAFTHSTSGSGYVESESLLLSLLHQTQTPDNHVRLASILNSLGPQTQTNFPLNRVPDLLHVLGTIPADSAIQAGIDPLTGTALAYTTAGMSVFLPRWDEIHALARRLIPEASRSGAVEVLNGSAVPGQAAALAAWLRSVRVRVRGDATAPAGDYPRTTVLVRPGATVAQRALAADVAAFLQVPIVTRRVSVGMSSVTVIIGRDYQSPAQQ